MPDVSVGKDDVILPFVASGNPHTSEMHFERGYYYAEQYWKRVGHLFTRNNLVFGGFPLGEWLARRRCDWRRDGLSQDRINRLDKIDMVWDLMEGRFKIGLYSAKRYFTVHGHCNAPRKYMDMGFPLGIWLINQRRAMKSKSLPAEAMKDLEAIGVVWKPLDEKQQKNRKSKLQDYICNHA